MKNVIALGTKLVADPAQHESAEETEVDQGELVFLTTRDVIAKTGLASTTLQRRRESDPTFPKPVVLSKSGNQPRCIRWVKSEVEDWMRKQLASRPE
jgi:predicted DNA-binding transcriptional regulator AlpA|tara:strand:- start:259 stop:549 length:291 start_codon:yes stop_codon:yes gene_type:complete